MRHRTERGKTETGGKVTRTGYVYATPRYASVNCVIESKGRDKSDEWVR